MSLVALNLSVPVEKRYTSTIGIKGSRVKYMLHNFYTKYNGGEEITSDTKLSGVFLKVLKHSEVSQDEKYQSLKDSFSDDENAVYVYWETPEGCDVEKFNKCMNETVNESVDYINNYKSKPKSKPKSDGKKEKSGMNHYSFWFHKQDTFIGKLIGFEGSNISQLKEAILENCNTERVTIKVFKSNKSSGNTTFQLVSDMDSSSEILYIKVSYSGAKNFKVVKDLCQDYLSGLIDESLVQNEEGGYEDCEEDGGGW